MSNATIPLSLYIHFPWCVRKCPYCDFNSCTKPNDFPEDAYLHSLIADLGKDLQLISERKLVSIFLGGGTPSLFSPKSIAYLLDEIANRIEWNSNIEVTMEANPTTFEQQKFSDFREAGINRLSIGVQSFQDDKLKALGRAHTAKEARRAIEQAIQAGFSNINVDIMHGLSNQSIDDALYDLQTAFEYFPQHLSWYQLTIEPQTVFGDNPPQVPQETQLNAIQEDGIQLIKKQGFQHYEISGYAQPDFQCRHNLNYWQFGDYLGIGAGAHGKVTTESFEIMRYEKTKTPENYLSLEEGFSSASHVIHKKDLPLEFMMNALRLIDGVPKTLFEERTGIPLTRIAPMLREAEIQGFLECSPDRLKTTLLGRSFLNKCLELFAFIGN